MTGEDYNPTGMDDADYVRITLTGNQMERWEGPLGIFDNIEDEGIESGNKALGEAAAMGEFRGACQEFLRNTRGLKLKPGPMNSHGRQAWSSVLQALSALERYSHD